MKFFTLSNAFSNFFSSRYKYLTSLAMAETNVPPHFQKSSKKLFNINSQWARFENNTSKVVRSNAAHQLFFIFQLENILQSNLNFLTSYDRSTDLKSL